MTLNMAEISEIAVVATSELKQTIISLEVQRDLIKTTLDALASRIEALQTTLKEIENRGREAADGSKKCS